VILRGVDWAAVLGGCTVGALILAGCVAFTSDAPPLSYLRLGLVALAAAAAFVLDEPAAAAVDAVPRTRRHRTAVRTAVVVLPFAIWAGGIGALAQKVSVAPVGALLVEGGGVLTVTVALGAILRMAGRSEPGEIVSVVTIRRGSRMPLDVATGGPWRLRPIHARVGGHPCRSRP